MTDVFYIRESRIASFSMLPRDIAVRVLDQRYEQLLQRVGPRMLPPRERLEESVLGGGGMGAAFSLSKGYELSGWVLKLTTDPGEAAVAALIAKAPGQEIPGLAPVREVLDLDVDVVDEEYNQTARVFAIWRRLVIPVRDYTDMVLEEDLMEFHQLAMDATDFAEHVYKSAGNACDALRNTAPTVSNKYMQSDAWLRHVVMLSRGLPSDDSKWTKAGKSIARHLAQYIAALMTGPGYHVGSFSSKLLDFLQDYDVVLCDLEPRNIGLMFRSENSTKPDIVVYDFGVPRFLTTRHDDVQIETI